MSRFKLSKATRGSLPIFVGLAGPSGGGKSFSALRLATGIQRVAGGSIAVIDTEANRALHYADRFDFLHLPFAPPFSPDDYWEAIQTCISAGAKTVIVDSFSHEHEGPGGVLEMHEAEVQRIAAAWKCSQETAQFPAWAEPKAQRRRLINNILQVSVNMILCFRAKRKVKMVRNERGKSVPADQGLMPIAGEEYFYEMSAMCVLPPGSQGVPDWETRDPGSEMITKRPEQFHGILKPGAQLSEDMGEAMARWAAGDAPAQAAPNAPAGDKFNELLALIEMSDTREKLAATKSIANKTPGLSAVEKSRLREAFAAAERRIADAPNPEEDGR